MFETIAEHSDGYAVTLVRGNTVPLSQGAFFCIVQPMEAPVTAITPDGRGRVLLTRLVDDLEDHYLGRVSLSGVITLVPAELQPKMVTDALEMAPDLFEELESQVASGTKGSESKTWGEVKGESSTS